MAYEEAFLHAFIYLAAALVAVLLGKRFGLGAVLGYLMAGAAIGPWGLHLIGEEGEEVMHFAEFGVVMMLFLVGLELQPSKLWRMRQSIIGLGSIQVGASAAAVGLIAWSCGLDWRASLATGLILSMSSTAIVLQSLTERGLMKTEAGQNSFAVLLFQDIAAIPIMAILPLLAIHAGVEPAASHGGSAKQWMAHLPGWAQALATVGAVLAVVWLGRRATRPLFRAIAATHQREAFTAAALLLVIGVALLMTRVGLSPALGAFVAGVVLASSEYRHELESDLAPFKGLLLGLFFIGVGIGIDFGHIGSRLWLVLGLSAGLLLVKGLLVFALARWQGSGRDSSLTFAAALASGGEFAFVLVALATGSAVIDAETSRTLVAVVAISMAATPLLILASQKLSCRDSKDENTREPDVEDEGSPVIVCGFGRFGHTVGRLLRTQGFPCTVLDYDPDQVETLRKIGIPVFYGDAARPDLLETAGAAQAKVLVIALKDAGTTLQIIETAHRHFPHLKIFIRAHSRLEAYEYIDAGEEKIYRDTLDSSLVMTTEVLQELGMDAETATAAAKLYRHNDEIMVRRMAAHRHDREGYANSAKDSVRALDELMRANALARAPEPRTRNDS